MIKDFKFKPTMAVTLGDPTGIGSEIVAKATAAGVLNDGATAIIIGSESHLQQGMRIANVSFDYNVANTIEEAVKMEGITLLSIDDMNVNNIELGVTDIECGGYTARNHKYSSDYCSQGFLDGYCFGPHNKHSMKLAGFTFDGAVDLIGGFFGYKDEELNEINILDDVFTARVTSHIPLKDVSSTLTKEKIIAAIELGHRTVKSFSIENPRIAVAALNPHGGEGGTTGMEEIEIIEPAVAMAKEQGINVDGPFPADTIFNKLFNKEYDMVITMYHDQGQVAIKVKDFANSCIIIGGLPTPVTSCAHGTAYDIVGKGIANPQPWINAYRFAVEVATNNKRKEASFLE